MQFISARFRATRAACLLTAVFCLCSPAARANTNTFWVSAYYAGWTQDAMPASVVDYSALTHVIHFCLVPNSDGTFNSSDNSITHPNVLDVVARTHAAGKKIIISVGGGGTESAFLGATSAANLNKFLTNLVTFMTTNHYDGMDIDWEPLNDPDTNQYAQFITGLHTAFQAITPQPLLTAAVGDWYGQTGEYPLLAAMQGWFDQLNIMTYDISGPYDGWVTWYNSPLYNGGYNFPGGGGQIPCDDTLVSKFTTAGIAPGKLAVGIPFYGYYWTGGVVKGNGAAVSAPRQSWTTAPQAYETNYDAILTTWYQPERYHWDGVAEAAWLGVTNSNPANNLFISYNDVHGCQDMVSYARNRGLGGVMIFDLGSGYLTSQTTNRDPLLQAVKQAVLSPHVSPPQVTNGMVNFNFTSIPLATYRVQWTSNLASTNWNTLAYLTNGGSGTAAVLNVTDAAAPNSTNRYYRVKTPP